MTTPTAMGEQRNLKGWLNRIGAAVRDAMESGKLYLQGVVDAVAAAAAATAKGGSSGGSMREEQRNLQSLLNRIRATLQDAERMEIRMDSMKLWLQELKDLADDIEDVLDDFEYQELQHKVAALGVAAGHGGSSRGGGGGADNSPSSQNDVMACKIADIRRRFDEIASHRDALNIASEEAVDRTIIQMEANNHQRRETSSFLLAPQVFGRDRVKEDIVEFLKKAPTERLCILAIAGLGGLGKTTLAQFVYNDERVRGHFDQRIWVHVSDNFDVKRVTKQIIEQVIPPQESLHQMDNLNLLQLNLEQRLRDKRFLLVLDDVWYEDNMYTCNTKWQTLCAPLNGGGKTGSKIMITTRSTKAVDISQEVRMIKLEALAFDDCWSLLKQHAFPDGGITKYLSLEEIGKKIVEKLNGVPLAATTIGSLLKTELEEQAWTSVLNSELWELEQGEGDILPALRLSYQQLPLDLKPCFAYFSVFRKGKKLGKLELVQLWMASGYIRSHGSKAMEDVGSDYLASLMSRSLVQSVDDRYFVHDLLHDLGRSIWQHDFSDIKIGQWHKSEGDQHQNHLSLSVMKRSDSCELENLKNFKKLRTLLLHFRYKGHFQIPNSFFLNLTCLRVLELSYGGVQELPDSIGNLRHLRYLDLRRTPIRCLPESLCSLYLLQTLKLGGCDQLSTLPKGMSNLISLRHLEAEDSLVAKIHRIGKLIHLQQLDVFTISEGEGINIEDLKEMNELRGKLCIQNLQRIGSKEEASQANMKNKKFIKKLQLEWVEDWDVIRRKSKLEEAVLDALPPPPNLKELTIKFYDGAEFPSWMKHYESVSSLESISLCRCPRWDALPPLLGKLPSLKTVDISWFPQVKELPPFPPTITILRLQGLGLNVIVGLERLPSLQELVLCDMPNVGELPSLPTTLRILTLENLGLVFLPELYRPDGVPQRDKEDNRKPLLTEMRIASCQKLRSLGGGLWRHHLPYLSVLSIKYCERLVCWPQEEGLRATLLSLHKEFIIEDCPKLMSLPEGSIISSSLKKLIVKNCPGFPNKSFFMQLQDMENLTQPGDVHVEKWYQDLSSCSTEALQQMKLVNYLAIQFVDHNDHGSESPCTSLVYDIVLANSLRRSLNPIPLRRLTLKINSSRDSQLGGSSSSTLSTCLLHHHLCSSLLSLSLTNMQYNDAFLCSPGREEEPWLTSPHLSSLQELIFTKCKDMRRLPVESFLCHLTGLKHLTVIGSPELTLPSVEKAIQSLPSLETLGICDCPKLSLPAPDAPAACVVDGNKMPRRDKEGFMSSSSSSSPPPPSWGCSSSACLPTSSSVSSSSRPLSLGSLDTDDVGLLANKQFACDYLSSVESLTIWGSNVMSFSEHYWLGSLRTLCFYHCWNLQELPPDCKSLFQSLKALCIVDCPRLRCMPERGLPASLEVLSIVRSPGLEVEDWPKVAHVRLVLIHGEIAQGSYSDLQEMVANEILLVIPA